MITTRRPTTAARAAACAVRIAAAAATAAIVASCTSNLHVTTRVVVTQADAGRTLHLRHGDLVVFRLPLRSGQRWTAVSDDRSVAVPVTVEEQVSTNQPPATFITVRLQSAGHATLTACPDAGADCSPATPGSVSVEVEVA
jgi:hypothetical protein